MLSSAVPYILQAITAEEKNACLCTLVYDILAARFGTRHFPCSRKQVQAKLKQHERALEKNTQLKNKARQALRRAKREGVNDVTIQSLAANFLSLL